MCVITILEKYVITNILLAFIYFKVSKHYHCSMKMEFYNQSTFYTKINKVKLWVISVKENTLQRKYKNTRIKSTEYSKI